MSYQSIDAGATERFFTVVKRSNGDPIVAGTVNYYLKAKSGANAGKWWRNSDQTWQATETANAMTHDEDGHWEIDLTSSPFTSGVRYLEYVKESGGLHVPDSRHLIAGSNSIVVSATSVAATAANDSGALTITRFSTYRAQITGLGSLAGRSGLKFVLKPSVRALKHTTDAQALLVIDEDTGLETLNAAAADDPSLASLTVVDEDSGTVDLFIDESVCGLLASRTRAPYSFKKLIAGGDDQELTSVDYQGGATTHARILEAVAREV